MAIKLFLYVWHGRLNSGPSWCAVSPDLFKLFILSQGLAKLLNCLYEDPPCDVPALSSETTERTGVYQHA